tara:strand:+ start:647 stop:1072 length:426 start_codon:yes stop_codon:yes gene_type:complete
MNDELIENLDIIIGKNTSTKVISKKIYELILPIIELEIDLKTQCLKKKQESIEPENSMTKTKKQDDDSDYDPMNIIPKYEVPVITSAKKKNNIYQIPENLLCKARKWGPEIADYPRCNRASMNKERYCIVHIDYQPFGVYK